MRIWSATVSLEISVTGEQTSNIIMMSDQNLRCISTTLVGEKKWVLPSYGDANITPSSLSLASGLHCLLSHRLNTWNPQLSVKMRRSRDSNVCSHPAWAIRSAQGWSERWNVFARISWMGSCVHKNSWLSINSGTPFTVAFVHTGINTGVVSVTPLRVIVPTLAFQRRARMTKSSLDGGYNDMCVQKLREIETRECFEISFFADLFQCDCEQRICVFRCEEYN